MFEIKFMKTKNSIIIAAITLITISSCKKNIENKIEEVETTFELSGNQAISDNLVQDDGDVLEEATARYNLLSGDAGTPTTNNLLTQCAIVTVSGNFPNKNIKIDFGTGCTSPNGITRKGIINIALTDSLRRTGAVASVTFNNYYVNSFKREGTITWTNNSTATNRTFNRKVTDGKITNATGNFWLHTSNIDISQTAGLSTPLNLTDDVYLLSGTRTVSNAAGKSRTSTTQTSLQKKSNCNNIDQGILKVEGSSIFALIDFGNGTCDNIATISINGNTPRTITLR